MEKFLAPPSPKSTPVVRRPWKRSLIELNGRLEAGYRHEFYTRLAHSYSEIGNFPHIYHANNVPCQTHINEMILHDTHVHRSTWRGVAGLEFDNKGIYIVSVTKSGCLTVHDFDTLYCQSKAGPGSVENEEKHVVHLSGREFDVARWNPTNQNEVACASRKRDKVSIFDISYMSSKPTEEFQTKQKLSMVPRNISNGLSDVAITSYGDSRIFAPDTFGKVHVWDRRAGVSPCIELSINRYDVFNSIQIHVDNQTIFGAGKEGSIHIWDLRGGRNSTAFQSRKDMSHLPVVSLYLAPMLWKIAALKLLIEIISTLKLPADDHSESGSTRKSSNQNLNNLQAQSDIVSKEIHSISVNPSSPHQLAFHLDDGWSGVVDIYKTQLTHVHCPPPAWLNGSSNSADLILRKPSWLPTSSIYVVGSMSEKGIHVLDFHPSSRSPCHVDYDEDSQRKENRDKFIHRNKFVSLSENVTGCTAHPLNSMIVAGTQKASLLLIAQRHCSSTSETVEGEL